MLANLGWPLILGMAACSVFYVLVYQGPLNTPAMHRYFASHPILFVEVGMFSLGAAALLLKLGDVLSQQRGLRQLQLAEPADFRDAIEAARTMLGGIDELPRHLRESYFGNRLRDGLEFVQRRASAAGLDEELKYLSDMDAQRQQESYALVRIVIWATPMLGFLGTVVGITRALGDLDPAELANSVQTAMDGLLKGLYVAFDTTAVALTLSILLMFVQFLIDRLETTLLATVDERAARELLGQFEDDGFRSDPQLVAIDRMSVAVAKTTEQLVQKQTELWQRTISESNQQWRKMLEASGEQIRTSLANALENSLGNHAQRLSQLSKEADAQVQSRWEQWQTALSSNARLLHAQQEEMVRQGQIMNEVVKATGEVVKLEHALNENLRSLSAAGNFEEAVMSLSAAVNLLSARFGSSNAKVDLDRPKSQSKAA